MFRCLSDRAMYNPVCQQYFLCVLFLGNSKAVLSEYLLRAVLKLLHKEVPENGRNLHQYFSFFWMYANLGIAEVYHLILW